MLADLQQKRRVHNLSSRHFTPLDNACLRLGLKMIPIARPIKKENVENSVRQLLTRLNKKFMNGEWDNDPIPPSKEQPDSFPELLSLSSHPKISIHSRPLSGGDAPPHLRLFYNKMKDYLVKFCRSDANCLRTAVPSVVLERLRKLASDKTLVCKPADKNLGIVPMDRLWYDEQVRNLVREPEVYQDIGKMTSFRILRIQTDLWGVWHKLHDLLPIPESVMDYALHAEGPDSCRIPILYGLPKIHKEPVCMRPICSSIGWITTPTSRVLHFLLQPMVKLLRTVLQNSTELVCDLERQSLPQDCTLVTADVTSLYPSIPHREGLNAMYETLLSFNTPVDVAGRICDVMEVVLTNNYVEVDGRHFLQLKGTAMGTPAAVVYANIFMWWYVDRELIRRFGDKLHCFRRFIDDLFLVVSLSPAEVRGALNSIGVVKFTMETGNEVHFLDLSISKGQRFRAQGLLDTKLYQKPMNMYLYVPFGSCHPRHIFRGTVKGELLRTLRASSDEEEFCRSRLLFFQRLLMRGYPRRWLEEEFSKVHFRQRPDALRTTSRNMNAVPLVINFHPGLDRGVLAGLLRLYRDEFDIRNRVLIAFNLAGTSSIRRMLVRTRLAPYEP